MSITSIAEQMVRREYNKKMITLPAKFWNLQPYKGRFQLQMRLAAKMIRAYSEPAVQAVIDRETWCYSLAAKSLPDLMEVEASNLSKNKMIEELTLRKTESKAQEDIEDVPIWRSPNVSKRSILDE